METPLHDIEYAILLKLCVSEGFTGVIEEVYGVSPHYGSDDCVDQGLRDFSLKRALCFFSKRVYDGDKGKGVYL